MKTRSGKNYTRMEKLGKKEKYEELAHLNKEKKEEKTINTSIQDEEKKFDIYKRIQKEGLTNMFDIERVSILSGWQLNKDDIIDIIKNYDALKKKYN